MSRGGHDWAGAARMTLPMMALCALSACGGGGHLQSSGTPGYGYAAPGPPQDPWGPYITEASSRFSVPDRWIRAVMHQESGGHAYLNGQPTTSDAGATGLMQVMPETYAELRARYNLGPDPYNPHDNIMAGTAYIREMYDRYGSPAFLAAYNAGPQRVEDYMAGRSALPNETINYLASVAPRLGQDKPMSGPLAVYADNGGAPLTPDPVPHPYARSPISGCWRDPDAAYDPDAPCRTAPPAQPVARPHPQSVAANPACWHDPNAAYDPDAPCQPAPQPPAQLPPVQIAEAPPPQPAPQMAQNCWHDPNAAYDPGAPCHLPPPVQYSEASQATAPGRVLWGTPAAQPPASFAQAAPQVPPASYTPPAPEPQPSHRNFASYLIPSAAAAEPPRPRAEGGWSIQVGAFASADLARKIAADARSRAPHTLAGAHTVLGTTAPFGGHVLYRARLAGLSAQAASVACSTLAAQRQACVTVPPGG